MHATVTPTGAERLVAPHELFYSTTDSRGVIASANSVFFRLAAYAPEELIGAPHNVIRHPDMPAGVFHTMWKLLQAGEPFAGYIKNLAQDGASYWTFATVTPTDGGFLSVRGAIMAEALWTDAITAYATALASEAAAKERGSSRTEVAAVGAQALDAALGGRGYGGTAAFGRAALTAEVLARAARTDTRPPPVPVHSPHTGVGDASAAVALTLAQLVADFDDYLQFADAASAARAANAITIVGIRDAACAATDATSGLGEGAASLPPSGAEAASLAAAVEAALFPLNDTLSSLRERIIHLRTTVALSKLHNDMVGMFAYEASAGGAPGDPDAGVRELGRALASSMASAKDSQRAACRDLRTAAAEVSVAAQRMSDFQKMLSQWRASVVRGDAATHFGSALAMIDARVSRGVTEMESLTKVGERCETLASHIERDDLHAALSMVNQEIARRGQDA